MDGFLPLRRAQTCAGTTLSLVAAFALRLTLGVRFRTGLAAPLSRDVQLGASLIRRS